MLGLLALAAASAAEPHVLWNGITDQTPAAEIQQRFAGTGRLNVNADRTVIDDYALTPTCSLQVRVKHPKGLAESVELHSSKEACLNDVIQSLNTKYGRGRTTFAGTYTADHYHVWTLDRTRVELDFSTIPTGFFLIYTVVPGTVTSNI